VQQPFSATLKLKLVGGSTGVTEVRNFPGRFGLKLSYFGIKWKLRIINLKIK